MWGFLVTLYVRFTSLEQPLSRLSYLLKIYFSELVWGCEVLIHESMLFFFFFSPAFHILIWPLEMVWLDHQFRATVIVQSSMTEKEWSVAYRNQCRIDEKIQYKPEESLVAC